MFRKSNQYVTSAQSRRGSFIIDAVGRDHVFMSRPYAGNTAYTRFFGNENSEQFVVKSPKYFDRFGIEMSASEKQNMDHSFIDSYKKEVAIWNQVYPNNQAQLFTENGLRMVLPKLPGKNMSRCLSDDRLTRCLQLLAAVNAVDHLHQIGYKYSDFNLDNVLLAQNSNGEWAAFLIDFDCMQSVNNNCGSQELQMLNILYHHSDFKSHSKNLADLRAKILQEIISLNPNDFEQGRLKIRNHG